MYYRHVIARHPLCHPSRFRVKMFKASHFIFGWLLIFQDILACILCLLLIVLTTTKGSGPLFQSSIPPKTKSILTILLAITMVAPKKSSQSHTPKKTTSHLPKKPVKANQSILSFFKKAEKHEASLFLGAAPDPIEHEDLYTADDADDSIRCNETESPNKKRKLG